VKLKDKHIVLGISGSIAAYKAATLLRGLMKEGAEVQVVITPSGKEFITPATLSALSNKPVISEFFGVNDGSWNSHVELGLWADLMIIAPATASTIGKMANGIADNMLITTYLSMKCPVMIAPAMDIDMYAHPSTQKNLETLQSYGNILIEPDTGELASGLTGKGRMKEPEAIIGEVIYFFDKKKLNNKTFLVTAGPTFEKIDPVRFIGNYSSGKMGFAIAEELASRGAKVILVAGPVQLKTVSNSIHRIDVTSAEEMNEQCLSVFPVVDGAVMCAAVADYMPVEKADKKLKRGEGNFSIELKPAPDIASGLGKIKSEKQLLVGFALETNNETQHALAKLKKKNLDFIVLNSLNDPGAGFQTDTNKITIIDKHNNLFIFELKTKELVAVDIVDRMIEEMSHGI
jgi:phosphopantothenoylcysteine decarboxylase/phosphopantothenate--cysteine ligase